MTEAKPCIACGVVKPNVTDDAVNQPEDGLYFRTHGQYGSRVFDPFDGSFLEIVVCDNCMIRAREQGRVLWGRDSKPVMFNDSIVGSTPTPGRPMLDWTGHEPAAYDDPEPGEDVLHVDEDDLAHLDRVPEIRWNVSPADLLKEVD